MRRRRRGGGIEDENDFVHTRTSCCFWRERKKCAVEGTFEGKKEEMRRMTSETCEREEA